MQGPTCRGLQSALTRGFQDVYLNVLILLTARQDLYPAITLQETHPW